MRQWDANNIGVDFGLGQPDAPLAAVTFRWAGKLAVRCLEASVLSRDGDEHLQRCERLGGRSWGFFSRLIERAASIWLSAVARVSLMPFIYHQVLICHAVYTPGLRFQREFPK